MSESAEVLATRVRIAASSSRLLGREGPLASLTALLESSALGAGRIAWLEGEAGIGKTRLLAETAEIARGRGFSVFSASGKELEAHRPFGVVAECLSVGPRSSDA